MKKTPKKTDYKTMFILGTIFLGIGVTLLATINTGLGSALIGIGAIYMLMGAKNKDKWRKK